MISDPTKRWKFNPADLADRKLWKQFAQAYEVAANRCSTEHAPWYVVPADRNWVRNAIVARIVRSALEEMDPQYPKARLGPEEDKDILNGALSRRGRAPSSAGERRAGARPGCRRTARRTASAACRAIMPPTITQPICWRLSAPAPCASASGTAPSTIAAVVIRIGRRRKRCRLDHRLGAAPALVLQTGWRNRRSGCRAW